MQTRFVSVADVQAGAVGFGVDCDGSDPQLAAGADHADGDLAAIGDQHLFDLRLRLFKHHRISFVRIIVSTCPTPSP